MGLNNLFVCLSAQNIRTSFNNARVTALVASTHVQDVEKENLTRLFASERQLCYQACCTASAHAHISNSPWGIYVIAERINISARL